MVLLLIYFLYFLHGGLNSVCFPDSDDETCFSCSSSFYSAGKLYSTKNTSVLQSSCILKNSTYIPQRKLLVGYPDSHIDCILQKANTTECFEFSEFLADFDYFYDNMHDAFINENSILGKYGNSSAHFFVFGENRIYPLGREPTNDSLQFFRRIYTQIFLKPLTCDNEKFFFKICLEYSKKNPVIIFSKEFLPSIFVAYFLSIEKMNIRFISLTNMSYTQPETVLIKLEPIIDRVAFTNAKLTFIDSNIQDDAYGIGNITFLKFTYLGGSVQINSTIIKNWISGNFISIGNKIDPEYRNEMDKIIQILENMRLKESIEFLNSKFYNNVEFVDLSWISGSLINIKTFFGKIKIQGLELINIYGISILEISQCFQSIIFNEVTIINSTISQFILSSETTIYANGLFISDSYTNSENPFISFSGSSSFGLKNVEIKGFSNIRERGNALILIESCTLFYMGDNIFYDVNDFKIQVSSCDIKFERTIFMKLKYFDFIFKAIFSNSSFDKCVFSELEGEGTIFNQYAGDIFFLNTNISYIKGVIVINFDELRNNIFANCQIFLINSPDYFWARNLKVVNLTFVNNTFSNSSFVRLQSFYREFSFFPLIIFKDCLFLNLTFGSYGTEYCCLDFFIINVTFKLNSLLKVTGNFFVVEDGGNYAFINSNFIDLGFSEYSKSSSGGYDQSIIDLWYPGSLLVKNSSFLISKNLGLRSGFISSINLNHPIYIENCSFIVMSPSALLPVKGITFNSISQVLIRNSTFINLTGDINNNAFTHVNGVISLLGSLSLTEKTTNENSILFENIIIINVISKNGAALAAINYNSLTVINCSFQNGTALNGLGGFIIVTFAKNLWISSSNFSYGAAFSGGMLYFIGIGIGTIENCIFSNSEASDSGGCISTIESKIFLFSCNFFNSMSNLSAGFLHQIQGSSSFLGVELFNIKSNSEGGAILLEDVESIEIISSHVKNIFTNGKGAFFYGDSKILFLNNNFMDQIEGQDDGALLYLENFREIKIVNSSLKNLECGKLCKDGFIVVKTLISESYLLMEATSFIKARSITKGSLLKIISDTKITAKHLLIDDWVGGTMIFCSGLNILEVSLLNIKASNCFCTEWLPLIYLNKLHSTISNFEVKDGTNAYIIFQMIEVYAILEKISIEQIKNNSKTLFNNQIYFSFETTRIYLKQLYFEILGSFIGLFYFENSEGLLEELTVISTKGLRLIELTNTKLSLNYCDFSIQNDESSKFINMIYLLSENSEPFQIMNSIFYFLENTLIKVIHMFSVEIINCTFKGISENAKRNAKAIYIEKVKYLNVSNSSFENLIGSNPGVAIIIYKSTINSDEALISISKSLFKGIQSENGAVLFFMSKIYLEIISCIFLNNIAYNLFHNSSRTFGSVCFFYCNTGSFDDNKLGGDNCLIFLKTNYFSNNSRPKLFSEVFSNTNLSSMVNNNFQSAYNLEYETINIITYPIGIILIQNGIKTDQILIQSGVQEGFTIKLVDAYGHPLNYDSSSVAKIQSPKSGDFSITCPDTFAFSRNGIIDIFGFILKAPGLRKFNLSLELAIYSDPIESVVNIKFQIPVQIKECQEGYVIQLDNSCHKCEKGTYSFFKPNNITVCEKCMPNFECKGGRDVFIIPGFWRKSRYDTIAVDCIIREACLGGNKENMTEEEIEHGACAEGHQGNLCFSCAKGFGKAKSLSLCKKCKDQTSILITRLILVLGFLLSFIIFNAYFFTRKKKYEKSIVQFDFVFFKVIFSHMQTISIVTFMEDLSSIPNLYEMINIQSYFSFVNDDFLSFDCILDSDYQDNLLIKTIGVITLPLVISCFCLMVWIIIGIAYFYRSVANRIIGQNVIKNIKNRESFLAVRRFLVSFALGAYLLYPMILQSAFGLPNCIIFNNGISKPQNFMFINPNIECWTTFHSYLILFLFLPSLALWGFLFPYFLLKLLALGRKISKVKRNNTPKNTTLESMFSKIEHKIFSFFYEDYKEEVCYWEIVIFFKKLILTGVAGMRNIIGPDLKLYLINIAIIFYSGLILNKKPFLIEKYNTFEAISGFITVIFILLLTTSHSYPKDQVSFLGYISIVLNAAFIFNVFANGLYHFILKRKKNSMESKSIISKKDSISKVKLNFPSK